MYRERVYAPDAASDWYAPGSEPPTKRDIKKGRKS